MGTMVLNDSYIPGAKNPVRIAPVVRMYMTPSPPFRAITRLPRPEKFLKSLTGVCNVMYKIQRAKCLDTP